MLMKMNCVHQRQQQHDCDENPVRIGFSMIQEFIALISTNFTALSRLRALDYTNIDLDTQKNRTQKNQTFFFLVKRSFA